MPSGMHEASWCIAHRRLLCACVMAVRSWRAARGVTAPQPCVPCGRGRGALARGGGDADDAAGSLAGGRPAARAGLGQALARALLALAGPQVRGQRAQPGRRVCAAMQPQRCG